MGRSIGTVVEAVVAELSVPVPEDEALGPEP